MISNRSATARRPRRRTFWWFFGRLFIALCWTIPLLLLIIGTFLFSFVIFPPFGNDTSARVLLVGLDDMPREGGTQRSDTIILYAAKLRGGGATLLSVPRDARVHIPGYRQQNKINAAYAFGKESLLKETLAQPDLLNANLPYHVVFDSQTVAAVVDALGGVEVTVPHNMKYDDNWGRLHIDLKTGTQVLNGKQVVGYLRWRKNNRGHISGDDFSRTDRQRQVVVAIKDKLHTRDGMLRFPAVYRAFVTHVETNLSLTQMMMLAWSSQKMHTDMVPGSPQTIRHVSYVLCDWTEGQRRWESAID